MGAFLALYGIIMLVAACAGGALAAAKNRDASAWAAWGFVFPPTVLLIALLPVHRGRRPRKLTLDEEDALY